MEKEYFGKLEDNLKHIPDKSVRMIFADFPFNTTTAQWDKYIDLNLFWIEAWRILMDDGVIICKAQVPFNIRLGSTQPDYLRYEWIWEKTAATGNLNAKKMPMKAHENLMVFYKQLPLYNPQMTSGHKRKVVSAKNKSENIERYNQKEDYIYGKEYADKVNGYDSTDRYPRSVLVFPSDKQRLALHPTQTPEALVEYIIKTYSNENDLILDPCRGSNTTGVVCDRLNRKYIGIEKDEYFYQIGLLRREFPLLRTKQLKQKYKERYEITT